MTIADKKSPLKILCIGAHCDDIEIGCGGTLLRFLKEREGSSVYWVVLSSEGARKNEARRSARRFLGADRMGGVDIREFRNGFFPYCGAEIKEYFEELKLTFDPDIVFTHFRNDLHQDHRVTSELTWNTFRHHLIFEYEIPKYDGDFGSPNLFVELDLQNCRRKIRNILSCFGSQKDKHWFSEDTFWAILRLRGLESGRARYAEGFYVRKIIL